MYLALITGVKAKANGYPSKTILKIRSLCVCIFGSSAVDGKRFLESNASLIRGTYFRLG